MAKKIYDPLAPLTWQQMRNRAAAEASAQLAPERQAANALTANLLRNNTGFTNALAKTLAGAGQNVMDAFGGAAKFGPGFAKGLSTMQGGPFAEAIGRSASALGAIGAQALGQQAQGSVERAAFLPQWAAGLGSIQEHLLGKQAAARSAEIEAKYPGLRMDILKELRQDELNKYAARRADEELDLQGRTLDETIRGNKAAEDIQRGQLKLQWAQHRQNESQFRRTRKDKNRERFLDAMAAGDTAKANAIDAKEKAIYGMTPDMAETAAAFRTGSTKEVTYQVSTGITWEDNPTFGDEVGGVSDRRKKIPKIDWEERTIEVPQPLSFEEAYTRMQALYGTILRGQWKLGDQAVDDLIMSALYYAGYTGPSK